MMKLELKHLAPYLPYELKLKWKEAANSYATLIALDSINGMFKGGEGDYDWWNYDQYKPILRPLSDLTKEIEHNGERFQPLHELNKLTDYGNITIDNELDFEIETKEHTNYAWISFGTIELFREKLFEWHFDLFNLIEEGLAIDINTLKK